MHLLSVASKARKWKLKTVGSDETKELTRNGTLEAMSCTRGEDINLTVRDISPDYGFKKIIRVNIGILSREEMTK